MKNNTNYYARQNSKKAMAYLKSGLYCDRREKQLLYFVVICSVMLCVSGIVFSMMPLLFFKNNPNFSRICSAVVEYLGFASGIFLVAQLFIRAISLRLKIEGVNSLERFDNYVYGLDSNRMIMRPMTEAQLENNAAKIKAPDKNYHNTYFSCDTAQDPLVIYNNQREIFVNEYHLMHYVRARFFNIIWFLFPVLLLGFALAANVQFFPTLQQIFFPSIATIALIVSGMIGYNRAMRFLQNTLTQFDAAEKDPKFDKRAVLTLRQHQDALFQYRMLAFSIPMFLIRRYEKSPQKQHRRALADDEANLPKTNPFITAEFAEKLTRRKRTPKKPPIDAKK
ncbi:MAG: S-4TM family putative pore-forming effector [Firmicutes bacterium]|nr:S-4TM family putative pore-forming effector [Bacillota bacterium]